MRNECYLTKFEWIALRQLGVKNIDFNVHKVKDDSSVLLRSNKLECVTGGQPDELLRLMDLCPIIRSFVFVGVFSYSDLSAIMSKVQGLESLAIGFVHGVPEAGLSGLCSRLKCLYLNIMDAVAPFLKNCPDLHT